VIKLVTRLLVIRLFVVKLLVMIRKCNILFAGAARIGT
jgi:hypothetical protein